MSTKNCSNCKRLLTLSCFYKDKRTPDGYYSRCKTCHQLTTIASRKAAPVKRNSEATLKLYTRLTEDQRTIAASIYKSRRMLGLDMLNVNELSDVLGLTPSK